GLTSGVVNLANGTIYVGSSQGKVIALNQGIVSQGNKLNFIHGLQIFRTAGGAAAAPGRFAGPALLHSPAQEVSSPPSASAVQPVQVASQVLPLLPAGNSHRTAQPRATDQGVLSAAAIDSLFAGWANDSVQQSLSDGSALQGLG